MKKLASSRNYSRNSTHFYDQRAVALVPCAYCGAAKGKPCIGARHKPIKNSHAYRRQDATALIHGSPKGHA